MTDETYLGEALQYGSVQAAEQALSGTGLGGGYYGTSPYGAGASSAAQSLVPETTVQGTNYATNAAWSQAVTAGLTDIGYTSTDVSAALGLYFAGATLTTLSDGASAAAIIQAALAEYGPPPAGSYQVILPATGSTGSGNTGTGTSTSTGTTTTSSTGSSTGSSSGSTAKAPAPAPAKLPIPAVPSGVSVSNITASSFVVHWAPDPHTSMYRVRVTIRVRWSRK